MKIVSPLSASKTKTKSRNAGVLRAKLGACVYKPSGGIGKSLDNFCYNNLGGCLRILSIYWVCSYDRRSWLIHSTTQVGLYNF